jgi:putative nucleotidyltransferase with HDIG domain
MTTTKTQFKVQQVLATITELETLPEVTSKALEVLYDSRSSSQELANVISLDQGIATRILAIANSAYFGSSRRFVTIKEAIMRLGYNNVRAVLYASSSSLNRPISIYGLGRNDLWRHSLACGIAARMLAREYRLWNPDEAYVAGLLHDIGLPALQKYFDSSSVQEDELSNLIRMGLYTPYAAEHVVLGFDHAYLGGMICRKWQMSEEVANAIGNHHAAQPDQESTKLACIIHLADVIAYLPETGACHPNFSMSADPAVVAWLGLKFEDLDGLIPRVRENIQASEGLLHG